MSARRHRDARSRASQQHGAPDPRAGVVAARHRRWLVCVDARIIGLHSVAAIHKLLKLCFDVRGRLAHWAAAGGDDGALSGPPGGGLLLRQAPVAYRWAALWMLDARSRGGGWCRVARRRWRRGRGRLCLPGLLHRAFVTLVQLPKYLTRAGVRAGLAWARRRLQRRCRRWPAGRGGASGQILARETREHHEGELRSPLKAARGAAAPGCLSWCEAPTLIYNDMVVGS